MKFYEKTWFIVLMALFIPPVALGLVLFKKKNWNKILKIAVTVILAFWSLLWVIALFVPSDSVDTEQPTTTVPASVITTKEVVTTKEGTTKEEKTTKEEITEENPETTTQKADTTQSVEEKTTVKLTPNTTKKQQEETTQILIKETTTKKTVTTTKDPDASIIVYRTATGECYHHDNPCGRGNYYEVSLADAKAAGLRPCEKCVLH